MRNRIGIALWTGLAMGLLALLEVILIYSLSFFGLYTGDPGLELLWLVPAMGLTGILFVAPLMALIKWMYELQN